MTRRLQQELASSLNFWRETKQQDRARLRSYQHELVLMRQFAIRPRLTIAFLLRQCACARQSLRNSVAVLNEQQANGSQHQ